MMDLDELERKAKRAKSADPDMPWFDEEFDIADIDQIDAEHIAANSPESTLAMIARIRELEAGLTEAVRYIGLAQDPKDDALVCSDFRVLVAKGIP